MRLLNELFALLNAYLASINSPLQIILNGIEIGDFPPVDILQTSLILHTNAIKILLHFP